MLTEKQIKKALRDHQRRVKELLHIYTDDHPQGPQPLPVECDGVAAATPNTSPGGPGNTLAREVLGRAGGTSKDGGNNRGSGFARPCYRRNLLTYQTR